MPDIINMESQLKHYLTIASIAIAIVVGSIAIWEAFRPNYSLEAYILSTKAPIPIGLKDDIKKLSDLSLEKIKKIKNIPEINIIPNEELAKYIPIFEKIIENRVDTIIGNPLLPLEHLTVVSIINKGNETLKDVQLKAGHLVKMTAQIIREDGKEENQNFTGIVKLGTLAPRSSISIYIYSFSPYVFNEYSTIVTHEKGVGEVNIYTAVPSKVMRTGGIFFSYQWTSITLAAILILLLLAYISKRFIKKRSINNSN